MATHTHNSATFEVSSEPMPARDISAEATTGSATLIHKPASPTYETNMLEFEKAILGWTRKDPANADRLNRYYPLTWPAHNQGSCDAVRLRLSPAGRTANETNTTPVGGINPTTVNNPSLDSWFPTSPRNQYQCDFGPLNYSRFMTDADAYATPSSPKELGRGILVLENPQPRELRTPDAGFLRSDTLAPVLSIGFVPFIQSEVRYIWRQVPYPNCVPWQTIEDTYLHVNSVDFDADELHTGYPAGTLLFRKVIEPDRWYWGPGSIKYVDLTLCFDYILGGWNYYLLPNGTYITLIKKSTSQPPYAGADFAELFNPGNP